MLDNSVALGTPSGQDYQLEVFEYTHEGQLAWWSDPAGVITSYLYDSSKRHVEETTWDSAAPTPTNADVARVKRYSYDVLSNLIKIRHGSDATRALGALDEDFVYDGLGRLTAYYALTLTSRQIHWFKVGKSCGVKFLATGETFQLGIW